MLAFQIGVELVQHVPLVSGPQGCDEKLLWTVSREPVDDDVGAQHAKAAPQHPEIVLHAGDEKGVRLIEASQICPF